MKRFTIALIKLTIAALIGRLVYRGIVFLVTDTGTKIVMGKSYR